MKARKKYGVKYPALYASEGDEVTKNDAFKFNCIQRGHQNGLEHLPSFLSLLLTAGFQYPRAAADAGLVYLAGRWMYFNGYSSGDPEKRKLGYNIQYIGLLGLLSLVTHWTLELQRDFWVLAIQTFMGIVVGCIVLVLIVLWMMLIDSVPYIIVWIIFGTLSLIYNVVVHTIIPIIFYRER